MQSKVLIMASSGFEQDELFVPLERLRAAGCEVRVAAPSLEPIRATVLDDPGEWLTPDLTIEAAVAAEWDALLLPGGLINPDHLRTNAAAVALVRAFVDAGKAVGAICHGPWLLIEADAVRGKRVTGWRSIRTDLRNAGGLVEDGPVVSDGALVTAVGPQDSAAFADALLEAARLRKA
jgi:protease I